MDFMTAVKTCFGKYVDFNGRARRSEFWFFALFTVLLSIVGNILDAIIGSEIGIVGLILSLAVLLPSLAVAARRLHDSGKSAWWLLLIFVLVIGWIVLLVFYVQDSEAGDNKHGPNPKGVGGMGGYGGQPGYGAPGQSPYGQAPGQSPYGG